MYSCVLLVFLQLILSNPTCGAYDQHRQLMAGGKLSLSWRTDQEMFPLVTISWENGGDGFLATLLDMNFVFSPSDLTCRFGLQYAEWGKK